MRKLSVIIPAYNEEGYIEKTLSCLYDADEIIVVCNGCTDKTAEIARKYTDKVIELKEKSVSRARNAGAAHASNYRYVFLDADIRVAPDLLKKIAVSDYNIGTSLVRADSKKIIDQFLMRTKSNFHRFGFCTGLIFCDKDLFFIVGGFEEQITKGEDGHFLRRAKKRGKHGVVDAFVYNNMRRFHKIGYIAVCWFWIREYLFPTKREYESVR